MVTSIDILAETSANIFIASGSILLVEQRTDRQSPEKHMSAETTRKPWHVPVLNRYDASSAGTRAPNGSADGGNGGHRDS
jgi:hypothetical protein